jgi:SH3-like domain-containing protein
MVFAAAILTALTGLPSAGDENTPTGPCKVTVQTASFNKQPSTTRGFIREAKIGEEVNVIAVEGNYAKVKLPDGTEAYISRSALTASEKYVKAPTNEKEMMEMKGQGYEAGRFDPETEANYKKEKGPEMDKAYKGVDSWEERQAWAMQRAVVSKRVDEFRKAGKLAEYSNVK